MFTHFEESALSRRWSRAIAERPTSTRRRKHGAKQGLNVGLTCENIAVPENLVIDSVGDLVSRAGIRKHGHLLLWQRNYGVSARWFRGLRSLAETSV
ncbi:hypothetical protein PoB_002378900 [Plakobranchus ocellatus]|uniref:Uncharacterized protein n=1 Tax=Plakobranchus ocellatus TaxID=259542 RepID=A0AAV3ZTT2_9GAST|nr:hypothetical protein PoB_002378900 [Plakobranchus ocellatus]